MLHHHHYTAMAIITACHHDVSSHHFWAQYYPKIPYQIEIEYYSTVIKNEFLVLIKAFQGWCGSLSVIHY